MLRPTRPALHLAASIALSLGALAQAHASVVTVAQYTAGTGTSSPDQYYVGQSLTTSGTTSVTYGDLRFSFYSDAMMTSSSAGTAYILDQPYTGTPAALSSMTAGVIGTSTGIDAGAYVFGSGTTLLGGTQYYVYTNSAIIVGGDGMNNPYAGGQAYVQYSPYTGPDYTDTLSSADFNFKLTSGTQVVAPGPFTLQSTAGSETQIVGVYAGQSVTTPTGGTINGISFNFFGGADGTTPYAAGHLYVLGTEYLGAPGDLSSSTSGFVAESTGIVDGVYQFDPSVTLLGGTRYYFLPDAMLYGFSGSSTDIYADGDAYGVLEGSNYSNLHPVDLNFKLRGTQAAAADGPDGPDGTVPEPEMLGLIGIAVVGAVAVRRRRKAHA